MMIDGVQFHSFFFCRIRLLSINPVAPYPESLSGSGKNERINDCNTFAVQVHFPRTQLVSFRCKYRYHSLSRTILQCRFVLAYLFETFDCDWQPATTGRSDRCRIRPTKLFRMFAGAPHRTWRPKRRRNLCRLSDRDTNTRECWRNTSRHNDTCDVRHESCPQRRLWNLLDGCDVQV